MTDFLLHFIIELHCKKGRGPGDHESLSKFIFRDIPISLGLFVAYFETAGVIA